jgi:hypothetical protein
VHDKIGDMNTSDSPDLGEVPEWSQAVVPLERSERPAEGCPSGMAAEAASKSCLVVPRILFRFLQSRASSRGDVTQARESKAKPGGKQPNQGKSR